MSEVCADRDVTKNGTLHVTITVWESVQKQEDIKYSATFKMCWVIEEQQLIGFPSVSPGLSATHEQTEMEMREGAAQGRPDNTEKCAESVHLRLPQSLTTKTLEML